MKIRKITSLTAGLPFLLMILTGVVLYLVPQRRGRREMRCPTSNVTR